MDAVLRAGRRLFDLVILDAVPVLPVADTVLMQDLVDGFQLVVRSRRTPREAIHDTLAKLRPDRVIGVVFNGHRSTGPRTSTTAIAATAWTTAPLFRRA